MTDTIVRIAARGDGVTESGRHVAMAVTGDEVGEDGRLIPGPHHQDPPCRHFPECGGCQLQHADDSAYAGYLVTRIHWALAQHGLATDIRDPHLSPPFSRRRTSLRALGAGGSLNLGFNAEKSNRIIDMRECHVILPELFALVAPLRNLLRPMIRPKRSGEVQMTLLDQGIDLLIKGVEPDGLEAIEALNGFAAAHGLARLSIDQCLGAETMIEPEPATVTLSGTPVPFPVGGFLQATEDGEAALVAAVRQAADGAQRIADLFAGIGTFALALEGKIVAAEASQAALAALKRAAPHIAAEHRDLYRRPYDRDELGAFDAVVLDPPRGGAEEQCRQLAGSTVPKIAYVSCNPATFSRDSRILADGGYQLRWVQPVGQFRWSTHVELAAAFSRE